jgi:hypothetical protein
MKDVKMQREHSRIWQRCVNVKRWECILFLLLCFILFHAGQSVCDVFLPEKQYRRQNKRNQIHTPRKTNLGEGARFFLVVRCDERAPVAVWVEKIWTARESMVGWYHTILLYHTIPGFWTAPILATFMPDLGRLATLKILSYQFHRLFSREGTRHSQSVEHWQSFVRDYIWTH